MRPATRAGPPASGRSRFMNWTVIRHVPPVLVVLLREIPSDATDVEAYRESDCGDEIRLELLGPSGFLDRASDSKPGLAHFRGWR
jgi:hypothetical protein